MGYHYSTGSYDGSGTTEIAYVPLILRGDIGRWSAMLTVPYLRISGPPVVTGDGVQTTGGESDGLGDILARLSYTLLPVTDWMPFIDLIGRVKFPSASRSDGLGTGELDYGFEVELTQAMGSLTPFVTAGYRILGNPPGSSLHNVALASLGATYALIEEINVGLFTDYREAASADSGMRLELIPFASWRITPQWSADFYVSAGLASGSPDVGTGLQIGWALP